MKRLSEKGQGDVILILAIVLGCVILALLFGPQIKEIFDTCRQNPYAPC